MSSGDVAPNDHSSVNGVLGLAFTLDGLGTTSRKTATLLPISAGDATSQPLETPETMQPVTATAPPITFAAPAPASRPFSISHSTYLSMVRSTLTRTGHTTRCVDSTASGRARETLHSASGMSGASLGTATGSVGPTDAKNGSWVFSKSGWTIAPTTVPTKDHAVPQVSSHPTTSTGMWRQSTTSALAPQKDSANVVGGQTGDHNVLPTKTFPSTGQVSATSSSSTFPATGAAKSIDQRVSLWSTVLLAFFPVVFASMTY